MQITGAGGVGPQLNAAPPPTIHVGRLGEDAAGIAAAHGIGVDQLMAANPQILHPSMVGIGTVLTIPPANGAVGPFGALGAGALLGAAGGAAAAAEPRPSGPEAAGPSPGGGTGAKLEIGLTPRANGQGVAIGQAGGFSVGRETLNGSTTYTGSIRVGHEASVAIDGKRAGVSAGASEGRQMAFEVVASREAGRLSAGRLAAINPFDARTIPPGVSVKIDASQFIGTEFEVQVREYLLSAGVKLEAGVTYQAQRSADGRSAQLAVGPYAAVEATMGVGVGGDVRGVSVSAQLARTDTLRTNVLATEKLDLSGGGAPVSQGMQQTTSIEYVSQSGIKLNASGGNLKVGLEIGARENSGSTLITANPDGTTNRTSTLYYDTAVPVTVSRTFNADGTERVADRTYSYTVRIDDKGNAELLGAAMGGGLANSGTSPLKPGDTVVLRLSEEQMTALRTDFAAAHAANPHNTAIASTQAGVPAGMDANLSFAVDLVGNGVAPRSDYLFSEMLFTAADWRDGAYNNGEFGSLPGELWVVNTGQPPRLIEPAVGR